MDTYPSDHDLLIRIDEHTKTHTTQLATLTGQIQGLEIRMVRLEISKREISTADATVLSEETTRRDATDRTWKIVAVFMAPATAISFKAIEWIGGLFIR